MEIQYNYITGNRYQGRNQVELRIAKDKNGYKSNAWLTFLQAKEKGLKIKKGSKAVAIFKGFEKFEDKNKDGKISVVSRPLGFASVFNLSQTDFKE